MAIFQDVILVSGGPECDCKVLGLNILLMIYYTMQCSVTLNAVTVIYIEKIHSF